LIKSAEKVISLESKRESNPQERADIVYPETFYTVSCFLGILEDFQRKKIKEKEAEEKCKRVFNAFREFIREKYDSWGTSGAIEAWEAVEAIKIIYLRKDIIMAKQKAHGIPSVRRSIDLIENHLAVVQNHQKRPSERVVESIFQKVVGFLLKK